MTHIIDDKAVSILGEEILARVAGTGMGPWYGALEPAYDLNVFPTSRIRFNSVQRMPHLAEPISCATVLYTRRLDEEVLEVIRFMHGPGPSATFCQLCWV